MRHPVISLTLIAALGAVLGYVSVNALGLHWQPFAADQSSVEDASAAQNLAVNVADVADVSDASIPQLGQGAIEDAGRQKSSQVDSQLVNTAPGQKNEVSGPGQSVQVDGQKTAVDAGQKTIVTTSFAKRKPLRLAALPPAKTRDKRFGSGDCPPGIFNKKGKLKKGRDAFVEQRMQWLLADYQVPEGAIVVMDPKTGELIAAAGYRSHNGGAENDRSVALEPNYLAASTFKIITASALLDRGLPMHQPICYHGGRRDVSLRELEDNPRWDKACADLSRALAFSLNVPMAKWTHRMLSQMQLSARARRFGFSAPYVGDARRCYGRANIPAGGLGLAETGAGFGEVRMSAWHGALIASIVAQRGMMPLLASGGKATRVLPAAATEKLAQAMAQTVSAGTAFRSFRERRRYALKQYRAAGKTGTLTEGLGENWREITWFIGFAPVDKPKVAVAAVIVNDPKWRIRAPYVGREALRTTLLRTEPYRPTQDPGRRHKSVKKKKHK